MLLIQAKLRLCRITADLLQYTRITLFVYSVYTVHVQTAQPLIG